MTEQKAEATEEPQRKGIIIPFGEPGSGKTTAVLETFPQALYYGTGVNGTHFFTLKRQRDPEYAARYLAPARECVVSMHADNGKVQLDSEGMPVMLNHKVTYENYLKALIKKTGLQYQAGEPPTYRNFIVDEIGVLYQRVFNDFLPLSLTRAGKVDTLGAWNLVTQWALEINGLYRHLNVLGINVILIAHNTDPDGERKGGPKLPSQGLQKLMTQEADLVLQRVIRDAKPAFELDATEAPTNVKPSSGPLRQWVAFASERWNAKNRGIPDEMLNEISAWDLEKIVRYAGIEP